MFLTSHGANSQPNCDLMISTFLEMFGNCLDHSEHVEVIEGLDGLDFSFGPASFQQANLVVFDKMLQDVALGRHSDI